MKGLQVNIRIGVFTVKIKLQHFCHAFVMAGGGMNILLYFFNVGNNYRLCAFINVKISIALIKKKILILRIYF